MKGWLPWRRQTVGSASSVESADHLEAASVSAQRDSYIAHEQNFYGTDLRPVAMPRWRMPHLGPVVERPEIAGPLVDLLCADDSTPVAVTGVHGTGGFGKTTLAKWVCHQQRVKDRFPGGLLWITIGEHVTGPELARRINDLTEQLTGHRPNLSDPQQAGFMLSECLDGSSDSVLIVVDDVWSAQQLEPFLSGGRHCRRLVTTRKRWILPPGARPVRVDEMTDAQAAVLIGRDVPPLPETVVAELLERTGRWPVLLSLVNRAIYRAIEQGTQPRRAAEHVLSRLTEGGPVTFDMDKPDHREWAVSATIRAGLDQLTPTSITCFTELGIFPEDADIPTEVLELLWADTPGLTPAGVHRICDELASLALIQSYQSDPGRVRLHDVIRRYLICTTSADALAAAHSKLLDSASTSLDSAVLPSTPGSHPWWTIPERYDYLTQHLFEHLTAAGRKHECNALVSDLRWSEMRIRRHGVAALETDLNAVSGSVASVLARAIRQQGHLLAPIASTDVIGANLVSRLHGIPALKPLLDAYIPTLPTPRLASRWPLRDQASPALLRTLMGHAKRVRALAVAPGAEWMASAGDDGTVRVWDPATGEQRHALTGHRSAISALLVAPSGKWLASGASNGTVSIWAPATGERLPTLVGHTKQVEALVAAPEGQWLASTGNDGTVRIWDPATGEQRHALTGHTKPTKALAVAPSGRWLASAGDDGTVRIWDPTTGKQRHTLTGHTSSVRALAVAPSGEWLASAGADRTVRIWDPATGEQRHTLTGHTKSIEALAVAPSGQWLASAGDDRTVRIWDPTTGEQRHTFTGHTKPLEALTVAPDGKWLASAGFGGTVRIWDPTTGEQRHALTGYTRSVRALAVAPSSEWLASAGDDRAVRIWDPTTGRQRHTLTGHTRPLEALAVDPGNQWLASAGDDHAVRIWDPATGEQRHALTGHTDAVRALAVASRGGWLASTGWDGTVRVWDPTTGEQRHTLTGHTRQLDAVTAAPGGEWLASAGADRTVRIWDPTTGEQRHTLTGHTSSIRTLATAPGGEWLASAGADRTVRIWDPTTGEQRHTLTGHKRKLEALLVDPAGKWLASAGEDRTVRIWDPTTGEQCHTLTGHTKPVRALAVAPGGEWLASAGDDDTVRIWDPTTGEQLHTLTGHSKSVKALAVTPSGQWLASASVDGTVRVWDPLNATLLTGIRVDAPVYECLPLPDGSGVYCGGGNRVYLFDLIDQSVMMPQ